MMYEVRSRFPVRSPLYWYVPLLHRCLVEGCSRIFTSRKGLRNHMLSSHEKEFEPPKGKSVSEMKKNNQRTCTNCGKVFNSPQALKSHVNLEHKQQGEIVCPEDGCTKKFTQVRYFKEHMKTHQQTHKCLYCTKTFGHKKTLNRHMRKAHNWSG